MKKYIKPEIELCRFSAQDIITDSALTPTTAEGYKPATDGESFNNNTYIFDWNN